MKVESFPAEGIRHSELDGFDATPDFQADWGFLAPPLQPPLGWKLRNKFDLACSHPFRTNRVFSYLDDAAAMLARPPVPYPRFPCAPLPGITPPAAVKAAQNPSRLNFIPYGHRLRIVLAGQQCLEQLPEPIVFINA